MPHKLRLFFAVDLAPQVKSTLIDFQSSFSLRNARAVPPENFHITLSFLGETSDRDLDLILSSLRAPHISPFDICLSHSIFWPKPKILGLQVEDQNKRLAQCKHELESQLAGLGIRHFDKKKYHPHVTLFRKVEVPPKQMSEFNTEVKIREICLMESRNQRQNVAYYPLETWSLKPPGIKEQLLGR
ncbi:RNA 2',3'-cyclic phosphodiesterase [Aliikangiella sp. G2MR2-5]|uniref:RNA 2',3'-cyclic phosphodiesterase n=1 Tax=Aliikangiella sp. G2MR2-5 TaxID=2788943 RepID=UPI0018A9379D|nr:RNA 2',3'-cyclic phosphodiesterase [Aliikangiella sp. G2MR2-5]